jgi:YidC/Oxa1 family membrane protein insertase
MEQHRMLIAIALSFAVFLLWEFIAGQRKPVDKPPPEISRETEKKDRLPESIETEKIKKETRVLTSAEEQEEQKDAAVEQKPRTIKVNTPLYSVEIFEKGAVVTSLVLKNYRETADSDSKPFKMVSAVRFKIGENAEIRLGEQGVPEGVISKLGKLDPGGYKSKYLLENALKDVLGIDSAGLYAPQILKYVAAEKIHDGTVRTGFLDRTDMDLNQAIFRSDREIKTFDIADKAETISFSWVSPRGIKIVKTYTMSPETYMIGLRVTVENGSDQVLKDNLIVSLIKPVSEKSGRYFEGPCALINDKLEKIETKEIKEKNIYAGNLKWIAMQDRYFLSSVIPVQPVETRMRLILGKSQVVENQYIQPEVSILPATRSIFEYKLFFGPKSMNLLESIGYDLEKAIDFGWFHFLAEPAVRIMNFLYGIIPNYGVAIIILTLSIKLLLWPLGAKSSRSMSKMKDLQPEIAKIREKYKNDKRRMNEETMRLYKTFGANPMSGCLLMLPQIPVFFALYRMLYETIELRHAPFFLWINDLSAPDRLFRFDFAIPFMQPPYGIPVMTVIMGASMLLQQKMQPMAGDPAQAKMMMLMPIVFTVIFINFSSGLVLYWLVNNILTIAQQYYVSKKKA